MKNNLNKAPNKILYLICSKPDWNDRVPAGVRALLYAGSSTQERANRIYAHLSKSASQVSKIMHENGLTPAKNYLDIYIIDMTRQPALHGDTVKEVKRLLHALEQANKQAGLVLFSEQIARFNQWMQPGESIMDFSCESEKGEAALQDTDLGEEVLQKILTDNYYWVETMDEYLDRMIGRSERAKWYHDEFGIPYLTIARYADRKRKFAVVNKDGLFYDLYEQVAYYHNMDYKTANKIFKRW